MTPCTGPGRAMNSAVPRRSPGLSRRRGERRTCDDRYQTRQSAPVSPPKFKILFALYSWFYFKNLSSVIEHLAREGHEVTVAAIRHDREDFYAGVSALAERYPNITIATAPKRRDSWLYLTWDLRQSASFLHFLDPRFD